MTLLNLAYYCNPSRTLGPGPRFVIWVQLCCFNCQSCVSPEWIPQTTAILVEPQKLAEYILSIPNTEGLTVSGGEPMLQAAALSQLFSYLREHQDLSIMCYSGFTLQQLQAKIDPDINQVLSLIDVLIDGQYIEQLDDNKGWRGSANQTVHFLTSRHIQEDHLFTERKRDVELHVQDDSVLMVGVPPNNFQQDFHQICG